jgi:hypothetical protein
LVAKIAVKLGVQNTNNELMALELKVCYLQFLIWCQIIDGSGTEGLLSAISYLVPDH